MSDLGDERMGAEGVQVCLGNCSVCERPVWRKKAGPHSDGPLVHKRPCAAKLGVHGDEAGTR